MRWGEGKSASKQRFRLATQTKGKEKGHELEYVENTIISERLKHFLMKTCTEKPIRNVSFNFMGQN